MNRYYLTLLTALLFLIRIYPQSSVLAEMDGAEITADEFKTRYELMPHLSERSFNAEGKKKDFLYSLIAEKLWALESERLGFGRSDAVNRPLELLEKMYVRDALFKAEIDSKIEVTERDIVQAEERKNTALKVNILSSPDSAEIFSIRSSLNTAIDFDSILSTRPEYKGQENSLKISFGDLDDEMIEDVLFNLKDGEISQPVKTPTAWFVFIVKERQKLPDEKKFDPFNSIKNLIKERRAKKLGREFLKELLAGDTVKIDEKMFYILSDEIVKTASAKPDTGTVYISESDFVKIMNLLGESALSQDLTENSGIIFKDFLYHLMFEGFRLASANRGEIEMKLSASVKSFIESELIAREGYKRGYAELPEVKREMKLWRENYLAQAFRNTFYDSVNVTDKEVYNYYSNIMNSNAPVTMVKISEILTNNLSVIEGVLDLLNQGNEFEELAAEYSERETTQMTGGEFDFFPVIMHGEIGKKAGEMNVGDIYGPIKVPEGYSIFKLLAKRDADTTFRKPFEEIKEQLELDLISKKLSRKYNEYTSALASKYDLKISESSLDGIQTTEVNFFTHRYMGFGGRITAVPFTTPWYEWIDEWRKGFF